MGLDSNMSNMSTVQFLENKTILITGGTGFLAKIFLEKVLRIQPNIAKIYLLIRAPDSYSLNQRFQNEVVGKDLFRVLKGKHGENFDAFVSEKVVPLAGDISYKNLGVDDAKMRNQMWSNLDIVVNFAATTNFDERYDVAMGINTWGALNILNFAQKCPQLKMLLHVSTAYVCGERSGEIKEKPFYMGETLNGKSRFDIYEEERLGQEMLNELKSRQHTEMSVTSAMKDFGIKRARQHGWPNTYVFTKAMGEMLLGKYKGDVPMVILRPTIITSTYQDPFPGWIEGLRTIDSILAGYGKGRVKFLPYNPHLIFDAMPADMVVNSIIVAMVPQANDQMLLSSANHSVIYHIGSSLRNPITFTHLQDYAMRYFTNNPLVNKDGNPITALHKVTAFSTMPKFRMFMSLRFVLPLKVLQLLSLVFGQYKDMYFDSNRKIRFVMRLADLYEAYMFFKGIFDDTNTEKLRVASRMQGEGNAFNFDPKWINWEDYFIYTHIPGLVKYVLSNQLASYIAS